MPHDRPAIAVFQLLLLSLSGTAVAQAAHPLDPRADAEREIPAELVSGTEPGTDPEPVFVSDTEAGSEPAAEPVAEPFETPPDHTDRPSVERHHYGGWTALAYLLPIPMVPIVHAVHGNTGPAIFSVVGFYGSFILGAYVGRALCDEPQRRVAAECSGAVLGGMAVGAIGWIVFDVAVLSYEDVPVVRVTPTATVAGRERAAGLTLDVAF